jgi:predicted nucleotidyltransferase
MTYEPKERQILDEVVAALRGHYGGRLSRVVLFGSRARRDHDSESDYDLLAVLEDEPGYRPERKALSDLTYPVCRDHDAVVFCLPASEQRLKQEMSPLMMNIRREGVTL